MRNNTSMPVFQLDKTIDFPPPHLARQDGLLAVGGDLSPARLLLAYRLGIFPWYSPGDPILWWFPSPRMVLFPEELKVSRRLARTIRQNRFDLSFDRDFPRVITSCATLRNPTRRETWLGDEMIRAYCCLHDLGHAHSVECWEDDRLVGGLYGVALGRVFFGESMFSLRPDTSKIALVALVEHLRDMNFSVIDCQVKTAHLIRMGAREISGGDFTDLLRQNIAGHHVQPAARWGE